MNVLAPIHHPAPAADLRDDLLVDPRAEPHPDLPPPSGADGARRATFLHRAGRSHHEVDDDDGWDVAARVQCLLRELRPYAERVCYRRCLPPPWPDDLVQHVVVQCWERGLLGATSIDVIRWARTALGFAARHAFRAERRMADMLCRWADCEPLRPPAWEMVPLGVEVRDELARVWKRVDEMPEPTPEILRARFRDGLTYSETVRMLEDRHGATPSRARRLIGEAIRRLQSLGSDAP